MKRLFKETPTFTQKIEEFRDKSLLETIQDLILENPKVGNTVACTGGLRKLRVSDSSRGKGKRGGLRVIYLDLPKREITYLLLLYGKDEAEDLTSSEKKILKDWVYSIKGE
ncbi:MAG: hypothetical protein HOO06_06850 [Bdellovibrionaceae bacterium]|jgi:hypothetical protein|nr:hypothetical protein [Pseudobdellovibrionaceae bacterium]